MSRMERVIITCPECQKQEEFVIWSSINTDLSPELKSAVLDGSLFIFKCPCCNAQTRIDYSCLYHQMDDKIMIQYAADDKTAKQFCDITSGKGPLQSITESVIQGSYLLRVVRSQEQFREKIAIFDAGFDDRLVELYKIIFLSSYRSRRPNGELPKAFFYCRKGEDAKIELYAHSQYIGYAPVSQELYKEIQAYYESCLVDMREDQYAIDQEWAINFLNQFPDD